MTPPQLSLSLPDCWPMPHVRDRTMTVHSEMWSRGADVFTELKRERAWTLTHRQKKRATCSGGIMLQCEWRSIFPKIFPRTRRKSPLSSPVRSVTARLTRCCRFAAIAEGICVAQMRFGSRCTGTFTNRFCWNNRLRRCVGFGWQCCQQSNSEGIYHAR